MSAYTTTSATPYGRGYVRVEFQDGSLATGFYLTEDRARTLRDQLTKALGDDRPTVPAPYLENAGFEDIRKGDLVRTEYTNYGCTTAREGVADHKGPMEGDWMTAEGAYLYATDARDNGGTITILERPEPEWESGDLVLDRDDDLWAFDGDRGAWVLFRTDGYGSGINLAMTEVERRYGPLRRAKVVEA